MMQLTHQARCEAPPSVARRRKSGSALAIINSITAIRRWHAEGNEFGALERLLAIWTRLKLEAELAAAPAKTSPLLLANRASGIPGRAPCKRSSWASFSGTGKTALWDSAALPPTRAQRTFDHAAIYPIAPPNTNKPPLEPPK